MTTDDLLRPHHLLVDAKTSRAVETIIQMRCRRIIGRRAAKQARYACPEWVDSVKMS